MRHLAEYRDAAQVAALVRRIRARSTRPWRIMEVCGGQTHGLLRNGLVEALAGAVEFLHGPGCPVCVTPADVIDQACALAGEPNTVVASYGDMLRVPGTQLSLWQARGRGAQVRILYSPLDAVTWAARSPETRFVVLAVGFETTAPATALAVLQAAQLGLTNFQVLTAHVRVLPVMEQLLSAPDCPVQAFLAAGHVCTVTGFTSYAPLVSRYQCPIVVTGFEPVDLLRGIEECVNQLEAGRSELVNCYDRSVQPQGNPDALRLVEEVFEVAEGDWRGLGQVRAGCLRLRDAYGAFAAHSQQPAADADSSGECPLGPLLLGQIRPVDCQHFGSRCTPNSPLGPPMISSEGACAAWYVSRRQPVPRPGQPAESS
ncbi:MAG: hydrogenase formation protein HypD [Planctomycetaceae bacterium]